MDNAPNKNRQEVKQADRDRLLALYNAAPYPEVLKDRLEQGTPLLRHWINAAARPDCPALQDKAHLLVAGCGSGAEVFVLAEQYPKAHIVGVDFSTRSIELARAKALDWPHVSFEVVDLTTTTWLQKYAPFDFVLCNGVADYVSDPLALMHTLYQCLSPNGVLFMAVNSPHHPAKRVQEAFSKLGRPLDRFTANEEHRGLLQVLDKLMPNTGIPPLSAASKAYLDVDIFPPIAHHQSMETWCEWAQEAGLHFAGSMDAFLGLCDINDAQIPLLYPLGRPALSLWVNQLAQRPGMQLLFSRKALEEPSFQKLEELWTWAPQLADFMGQLPALDKDPKQALPIRLSFQGLPDFVVQTTAYDLEVFRHCDGKQRLADIIKKIPVTGDLERLRRCLFRAYHFGLLL